MVERHGARRYREEDGRTDSQKAGTDRSLAGLIDTAVQPQSAPIGDFLLSPLSVAGEASPPEDSPTHGTAMSETILAGLAQA